MFVFLWVSIYIPAPFLVILVLEEGCVHTHATLSLAAARICALSLAGALRIRTLSLVFAFVIRYGEIIPGDQLSQERAAKRVFAGFQEGPITFAPSYRVSSTNVAAPFELAVRCTPFVNVPPRGFGGWVTRLERICELEFPL